MYELDTIAAIVTAKGYGAVGIIRLSGPDARQIGAKLYSGQADLLTVPTHTIHYGWVESEGEKIDEALFMVMDGPHSFTGENVVEIQCHGGPVSVQAVLEEALLNGARMAERGEFSKRAFLNGKMDLTQAEAIMDLVDAKTEENLQNAARQRFGYLREEVGAFREELMMLEAYMQADLDYPEDDIDRLSEGETLARAQALTAKIDRILATSERGRLYKEGVRVAIAGKPNVGKSSLLNALLGYQRAIVTDIAGTTRDVVTGELIYRGLPLEFLDTAGIRETADKVEAIGVNLARESLQSAQVVAYVLEPTLGFTPEDEEILAQVPQDSKMIVVLNKVDLPEAEEMALPQNLSHLPLVRLSTLKREGLEDFLEALYEAAISDLGEANEDFVLTNTRHMALLKEAQKVLKDFVEALEMGMSEDMLVIDLQRAWELLGLITGDTAAEDLLDTIFANFCLGK